MPPIIGAGFIGAGNIKAPNTVAGLYAWFHPTSGKWQDSGRTTPASANNDPVGAWDDASGSSRHVTQATAADRPLLKTSIINGFAVQRFDGATDFLQRTSAGFSIATPQTIFCVGLVSSVSAPGAFGRVYDSADSSVGRALMGKHGDNSTNAIFAGTVVSYAESLPTTMKVWSAVYNGASSALWRNGTQVVSGNAGTNTMSGLRLGAGATAGGGAASEFNGCDIAEFVVYSAALSASDRIGVENYLRSKYAL